MAKQIKDLKVTRKQIIDHLNRLEWAQWVKLPGDFARDIALLALVGFDEQKKKRLK